MLPICNKAAQSAPPPVFQPFRIGLEQAYPIGAAG